jgi:predicted phosphodiesterase
VSRHGCRRRCHYASGMESVAVLSDIHGVLPALDAVLAEPSVRAADRIVLTGDIAAGPQPSDVLDRLIGLGDRVTWVRGNADRELIELARGEVDDVGDPIAHWAARQLGADHLDWLASLPLSELLDVGGFGPVLFCHATPRDDAEVVVVDSRLERWAEVLAGLPDEVMTVVCGHTHMPFARLANRRQIVNPGSVGMPYGRVGAHWALLTGGAVELRRTAYDVPAACASVCAESAYPDIAEWTDYFLNSRASDADALAVMAPRDGRLPTAVTAIHLVRVVTQNGPAGKLDPSAPTGDLP